MRKDLNHLAENDHMVADADALWEVLAFEDKWEVDCAGIIARLQVEDRWFSGFGAWLSLGLFR